jgi:hypothetical protein
MANGLFTLKQVNQALRQSAWTGQKTPSVQYLVVAGGGGAVRGGGGGGGLLTGVVPVVTGSSITVTVGSGGVGRAVNGTTAGGIGGSSIFSSISATGGGGGGADTNTTPFIVNNVGQAGGSGGGGPASGLAGIYVGGQGIFNQGNAGGSNGGFASSPYPSGGGGGAGTIGLNASNASTSGNGGSGVASSISGTTTSYSGGGGGANYDGSGTQGSGGVGGGASGSNLSTGNAGTANTGGGGGGTSGSSGYVGGNGGSGIVILSYPDTYAAAASTTGSPTVSTSGSGSFYNNANSFTYTPSSSTYNLGSNNFTLEMWINVSTQNNLIRGISQYGFAILLSGGQLQYYLSSNGTSWDVASAVNSGSVSLNTWTHIALVRNGTVFTPYVNGVAGTSTTSAATISTNNGFCLLSEQPLTQPAGSGLTTGYVSNFRAVIGNAIYTSNFTPSTIPLTPTTNTKVLLNTVSGSYLADSSSLSASMLVGTNTPSWNSSSPFATGLGYKNRVYTWTSSGSITF